MKVERSDVKRKNHTGPIWEVTHLGYGYLTEGLLLTLPEMIELRDVLDREIRTATQPNSEQP